MPRLTEHEPPISTNGARWMNTRTNAVDACELIVARLASGQLTLAIAAPPMCRWRCIDVHRAAGSPCRRRQPMRQRLLGIVSSRLGSVGHLGGSLPAGPSAAGSLTQPVLPGPVPHVGEDHILVVVGRVDPHPDRHRRHRGRPSCISNNSATRPRSGRHGTTPRPTSQAARTARSAGLCWCECGSPLSDPRPRWPRRRSRWDRRGRRRWRPVRRRGQGSVPRATRWRPSSAAGTAWPGRSGRSSGHHLRPEQQRQQQRDICGYLSDHGAGR